MRSSRLAVGTAAISLTEFAVVIVFVVTFAVMMTQCHCKGFDPWPGKIKKSRLATKSSRIYIQL